MANSLEGSQASTATARLLQEKHTALTLTCSDKTDLKSLACLEFSEKLIWKFVLEKTCRTTRCVNGNTDFRGPCDSCALRVASVSEKKKKKGAGAGNRLQLTGLIFSPTSFLVRDLNYRTGGYPTKSSRISSSAAAFTLRSAAQMDSNHLTVRQHFTQS